MKFIVPRLSNEISYPGLHDYADGMDFTARFLLILLFFFIFIQKFSEIVLLVCPRSHIRQ